MTTDRSGLVADGGGLKLATVVVLVPGGRLDLHRFILSLVEQKEKFSLEAGEEVGFIPPGSISRIEANITKNPLVACLNPLSGPLSSAEEAVVTDQAQAFPYYAEITVE